MTVYKYYLQIVKKNIGVVIMYFIIFSLTAIIASSQEVTTPNFKAQKPKIFLIDNDNSNLFKSFSDYVKTNYKIVKLQEDKVKDAIFNMMIDYVIKIPKGFETKFINTEEVQIETDFFPNSFASKYIEMDLNKYFNYYRTYLQNDVDLKLIPDLVSKDLKISSQVNLLHKIKDKTEGIKIFFNMMNYTVIGTCLYIIGLITSKFVERRIKRRNLISATSIIKTNKQLFLGHLTVMFGVWLYYIILSTILYKEIMLSITGVLLMVNSLLFSIMVLSLAFLLGMLIKKNETRGGIINVIGLGSSFLCGAFVPMELLPSTLQTYTQFIPSYWYIVNNKRIIELTDYSITSLKNIFTPMLILIAFSIFFFIITNLVAKSKKKEE